MRVFAGLCLLLGGSAWAQPALLQPGQERAITEALSLRDLREIPDYNLDISLSDRSGHFEGRGTLKWTNRTGRTQRVLPFLLHTNGHSGEDMAIKGGMRVLSMSTRSGPEGRVERPRPSLANYVL